MNKSRNADIYARIKALSYSRGISLKNLAAQLGFSKGVFAQMNFKKSAPSAEVLLLLSDFFGVSIDYLLTGKIKQTIVDEELVALLIKIDNLPELYKSTIVAALNASLVSFDSEMNKPE